MTLNLEDYFRTFFEEQLLMKLPVQEEDLKTGATRLLEKRREIKLTDISLRTQREEFEVKRESFRQRRDELKKKEEKLKESLLKFDKFLKENDAKRARGERKAEAERALVKQKEQELERLERDCAALLARKQQLHSKVNRANIYRHFLDTVVKMSKKFEDIGHLLSRFNTLVSNRDQLLERESVAERERERERLEQRHYISEQGSVLLQCNNRLSELQTELDHIHSQAIKWEAIWNHIQSFAAKETLLLGQIKVVTLNLYHMTGAVTGGAEGVSVEDTVEQLERIQLFIRDRADIVSELNSDAGTRSITN